MKFSIIIPTFGRPVNVIEETLTSILKLSDEIKNCESIFLIDQNVPTLDIASLSSKPLYKESITYKPHVRGSHFDTQKSSNKVLLVHITGGKPSTTMAKNYALKYATSEYLIFFDDDVIVQPGCIRNHIKTFLVNENTGLIGGREIVFPKVLERSKFRSFLINIFESISKPKEEDRDYQLDGIYIGRIKDNSFMISNFDIDTDQIIKVDGVRGCNWSTSLENIKNAGRFDEKFQGTALREETDLFLRIKNLGKQNYYAGKAVVHHMRQLGGCGNLAQSMSAFKSKLINELYFQRKHFSEYSSFYFYVRTLPLALENATATFGLSLLYHFKLAGSFFLKKKI